MSSITPTPHQLRALTHPVRLRMLGLLRLEGPATATSLATRLGLNTGATSYHLRQLATHGFIVDDDSDAEGRTGRERWWRAAHSSTRTVEPDPDDLDARQSTEAYVQSVVTVYASQMQRAVEELPLLPQAWREAGTFSDWHVRVTPAKARALVEAIEAVVLATDEDDESSGEPQFVIQLNAYPRPGQLGEDVVR